MVEKIPKLACVTPTKSARVAAFKAYYDSAGYSVENEEAFLIALRAAYQVDKVSVRDQDGAGHYAVAFCRQARCSFNVGGDPLDVFDAGVLHADSENHLVNYRVTICPHDAPDVFRPLTRKNRNENIGTADIDGVT